MSPVAHLQVTQSAFSQQLFGQVYGKEHVFQQLFVHILTLPIRFYLMTDSQLWNEARNILLERALKLFKYIKCLNDAWYLLDTK